MKEQKTNSCVGDKANATFENRFAPLLKCDRFGSWQIVAESEWKSVKKWEKRWVREGERDKEDEE